MKLNQAGWFILLWLGGFLTMVIIAGIFRFLLHLAY
ncbi:DUF2474 domain-containing protein [Acinetobacter thermotolerans]|nr:DUF2474 domain-containing protein [Acinetobacter sp. HR7]